YWIGTLTAFMTAFYVFRALFMTFFGEYRGDIGKSKSYGEPESPHPDPQHHASGDQDDHGHGHGGIHESPASMWIPLAILAVLSLVGGYINIPKWLEPMFKLQEEAPGTGWTVYVSVAAGLIGIALAAFFYLLSPGIPESLARTFSTPYRWIYNKYYVDEFYD